MQFAVFIGLYIYLYILYFKQKQKISCNIVLAEMQDSEAAELKWPVSQANFDGSCDLHYCNVIRKFTDPLSKLPGLLRESMC